MSRVPMHKTTFARLIAELSQVSVKTVNEQLINIYDDGELVREATIRRFRIVQREGTGDIDHYNLDAILAVGHRVRSARATNHEADKRFAGSFKMYVPDGQHDDCRIALFRGEWFI